jgi:hypothetical protein
VPALLPLLAADPSVPPAFRDACLALPLDLHRRSWRDQVVEAVARNPALSGEQKASLLARGSADLMFALLNRPGLTVDAATRAVSAVRGTRCAVRGC